MSPGRRSLPYPLLALLVTAALVGALWALFARWWPDGGTLALEVAGGIGLVAAWIAHRAGQAIRRRMPGPDAEVTAHLVGLGLRMFLTLLAALAVLLSKQLAAVPFGVAISAVYLSLLALEVFVTLRSLRQNPAHSEAARPTDDDAKEPGAESPRQTTAGRDRR